VSLLVLRDTLGTKFPEKGGAITWAHVAVLMQDVPTRMYIQVILRTSAVFTTRKFPRYIIK